MKLEVGYYAECSETGERWFDPSCRNVYNAVLRSFRADMHDKLYYDCRHANIKYGVMVDGWDFDSYYHICSVHVSGMNHHVNTYIEKD